MPKELWVVGLQIPNSPLRELPPCHASGNQALTPNRAECQSHSLGQPVNLLGGPGLSF